MRLARPLFISTLLSIAALHPITARAHALLLTSEPSIDGTVAAPQADFVLHFNSRIDTARSRLTLKDANGETHSLPPSRGETAAVLKTHADGLTAGHATLHWEVLSADGHISSGDLPFSVTRP